MKYNNQTERAIATAKAQCAIEEYLRHFCSYTEIMEYAAKAQTQVFHLIAMMDKDRRDECHVEEISEFFFFAIKAFELLEPFTDENLKP